MSIHVHGMVVTHFGFASNNRSVTEGNTTTLQKCNKDGKIYTIVNSEAIRHAVRMTLERQGVPMNRHHPESEEGHNIPYTWADGTFKNSKKKGFADDDGMGYMTTSKGGNSDEGEADDNQGKAKGKGSSRSRTSRFCVNRAISLRPYTGDVTFNVASPGATPGAAKTVSDPTPYCSENHATSFQYPFTMTPSSFLNPAYVKNYLLAVSQLMEVGGNQARSLYDFSPETILLRVTHGQAPRFNYCFVPTGEGTYDSPELLRLVEAEDILPSELYVGGKLAATETGQKLKEMGCHVFQGVDKCFNAVIGILEKSSK